MSNNMGALYAPSSVQVPIELRIKMFPRLQIAELLGTQEMLKDEGLIPDKFTWPSGFRECQWDDGPYEYRLRRTRPDGVKGPRRAFENIDWWELRWSPTEENFKAFDVLQIAEKQKELNDLLYRQSPDGKQAVKEYWKHRCAARDDIHFQAFKALIPGLEPSRRGRKPTKVEQIR